MIEINLIPDVKQELIKAQQIRSTVITGCIFVGITSIAIVILLALYVYGVQTVRSNLDDTAISQGSAKLESVKDLSKTLTIQNQLTQISTLNNEKNDDSRIFDMLEAVIPAAPNNISVTALSIDSSLDTITLQAQASNGYTAAEVFKKTVGDAQVNFTSGGESSSEPLASDINLTNTAYGLDSDGNQVLQFTLSFNYDQDLFSPESSNVTISIANSGNATDSFLGVPTSIFAAPATSVTPSTKEVQ
jgi:hypothetical protein